MLKGCGNNWPIYKNGRTKIGVCRPLGPILSRRVPGQFGQSAGIRPIVTEHAENAWCLSKKAGRRGLIGIDLSVPYTDYDSGGSSLCEKHTHTPERADVFHKKPDGVGLFGFGGGRFEGSSNAERIVFNLAWCGSSAFGVLKSSHRRLPPSRHRSWRSS